MLRINAYATASTDSAAYIIGGIKTNSFSFRRVISTIAEYKNNLWRTIGNLNEPKYKLSAISHNGGYMVVGGVGYWTMTTEFWNFNATSSREINSFSSGDYYTPILFHVDSSFCV